MSSGLRLKDASGLENLAEIASVKRLDVLFVGVRDPSISLGVPRDYEHGDVQEAVGRVEAAARESGMAVGMIAQSPEHVRSLADPHSWCLLGFRRY